MASRFAANRRAWLLSGIALIYVAPRSREPMAEAKNTVARALKDPPTPDKCYSNQSETGRLVLEGSRVGEN